MNKDLLEKGFIPEEICTDLPDGFKDVEEISSSLHKILANNQINNVIKKKFIKTNFLVRILVCLKIKEIVIIKII